MVGFSPSLVGVASSWRSGPVQLSVDAPASPSRGFRPLLLLGGSVSFLGGSSSQAREGVDLVLSPPRRWFWVVMQLPGALKLSLSCQ